MIKIIDSIEDDKTYNFSNREKLYRSIVLYFYNDDIDSFIKTLEDIRKNGLDIKHILNHLFEVGLHDEVIVYVNNKIKDKDELQKIKEIFKSHKLELFPLFFTKLDFDFNGEIQEIPTAELLNKIKQLNPNKNLSEYIEIYGQLQSKISTDKGADEYLKIRRMYPHVSVIHHWNLRILDLNAYYQRVSTYVDEDLSDLIFLTIIDRYRLNLDEFAVNKICRLINVEFIDEFKEKFNYNDSDWNNLILNTIQVESKSPFYKTLKVNNKKEYDFAICISGQFRGGEECLPYWLEQSTKKDIPVFLSIWDKIGIPSGAHGNKLQRMVYEELKDIFSNISDQEFFNDLPDISEIFEDKSSLDIINSLVKDFPNVEMYTNIIKEDEIDFLIKKLKVKNPNQFKMFYNMTNVINMLKKYEYNNGVIFKNIIWVRPDVKIKYFKFSLIDENKILMHFIGDFLMQFPRRKCVFMEGLENLFVDNFNDNKILQDAGPLLLKRSAWFNGLYVDRLKNYNFLGLISPKPSRNIFYQNVFTMLKKKKNIENSKYFELFKISYLYVTLFSNRPADSLKIIEEYDIAHDFCANWLRDVALMCEKDDVALALKLMQQAQVIRKDGPLINRKIDEYKLKLGRV